LQDAEFDECRALWDARPVTAHSWRVLAAQIVESGYNLDVKNPANQGGLAHRTPEELVEAILDKEQRIAELVGRIKQALRETGV